MTANRTQSEASDSKLILELKIDANGEVTRKATKLGRKDTLEGKLLAQLYPGIRVARVTVPSELTPYEQSVVENSMAQLNYGGVEYKLVGASGSAKDGKFYFVDQANAKPIVERFQHWPEAAHRCGRRPCPRHQRLPRMASGLALSQAPLEQELVLPIQTRVRCA